MSSLASPTKIFHKTTYPSINPERPELSAKGKIVVITGGGTGIGAETAKYFARAGADRIAILGRRERPLLETKSKIESTFPSTTVLAIPTDVTVEDQVQHAFERAAGNGKIDVLVSNAAVIGPQVHIKDVNVQAFMAGVITNLQSNVIVAQTFLRYASDRPVIVEVNSAAAHLTMPAFACYIISKTATARFYDCLSAENPQLLTFSIQPGAIDTDMSRQAGYKPTERQDENFKFEGPASTVLGSQDDVSLPASFMVWLASPEAHFLKGKYLWANWDVDELKARAKEIESGSFLSMGLVGWPFM